MRSYNPESKKDFSEKAKKPKPIKIKKDLQNSSRFKVPIPVRISSLSDDKLYSEYKYTTHSKTKTNRLATINDFRSKSFNPNSLVASKNYAPIGTNWMNDPTEKPKLSNEKVKIELTKEYFSNPHYYTESIISNLINKLDKDYSFSEDELQMLTDKSKNKERLELIEFTDNKLEKADENLVNTINTINILMDRLKEAERIKEGTYANNVYDYLLNLNS